MIKLGGLQSSRAGQGGGDLGLWERPKVFFFGATCNGGAVVAGPPPQRIYSLELSLIACSLSSGSADSCVANLLFTRKPA